MKLLVQNIVCVSVQDEMQQSVTAFCFEILHFMSWFTKLVRLHLRCKKILMV